MRDLDSDRRSASHSRRAGFAGNAAGTLGRGALGARARESTVTDVTDALNESTDALNESTDALNESTDALNESTDALNESTDALNESTDALNESTDALNESTDALNESTDALNESTDALNESTDVTDALGRGALGARARARAHSRRGPADARKCRKCHV